MLAMLCVGWRLGVDFQVMVGRQGSGAFAAVNLPSEKCPAVAVAERAGSGAGGISSTCI